MKENPHEKCMVIGRTQQILANILHIFIRIGAGLMRTMGGVEGYLCGFQRDNYIILLQRQQLLILQGLGQDTEARSVQIYLTLNSQ